MFDIMLSYSPAQQNLAQRIRAGLAEAGFTVWFNIEQTQDKSVDTVASAVENSSTFVYCMSAEYKESTNCHMEANYAHTKKKPMVPLMVDDGYAPSGWLGFLLGSHLWYGFSGGTVRSEVAFAQKMDELVKVLKKLKNPKRASKKRESDYGGYVTFGTGDALDYGDETYMLS